MIYLLEVLFPYILLFYLVDCFIYVQKDQVAFVTSVTGKIFLKKPGIRFIGISPFCRVYTAQMRPLFFSEHGIHIMEKQKISDLRLYRVQDFDYIGFETINDIEYEENRITINQEFKIDFHAPDTTARIAKQIRLFKETEPAQRNQKILEWMEAESNPEPIKEIISIQSWVYDFLSGTSFFLFLGMFIMLPLFLYARVLLNLNVLLICMLIFWVMTLVVSYICLSICLKMKGKMAGIIALMVLSPVTAIHAIQNLTRHSLDGFDSIAVSAVFLDGANFEAILKKEIKRLHYSAKTSSNDDFRACLDLRKKYLEGFLVIAGMTEEQLFKPPEQFDHNAAGYCPFCEAEYMEGVARCMDCEIDIKFFDSKPFCKKNKIKF